MSAISSLVARAVYHIDSNSSQKHVVYILRKFVLHCCYTYLLGQTGTAAAPERKARPEIAPKATSPPTSVFAASGKFANLFFSRIRYLPTTHDTTQTEPHPCAVQSRQTFLSVLIVILWLPTPAHDGERNPSSPALQFFESNPPARGLAKVYSTIDDHQPQ